MGDFLWPSSSGHRLQSLLPRTCMPRNGGQRMAMSVPSAGACLSSVGSGTRPGSGKEVNDQKHDSQTTTLVHTLIVDSGRLSAAASSQRLGLET